MSHVDNMNFSTFYEIDLIPIKCLFSKTVIIAGERDKETLNSSHEAFGQRLWQHHGSSTNK